MMDDGVKKNIARGREGIGFSCQSPYFALYCSTSRASFWNRVL